MKKSTLNYNLLAVVPILIMIGTVGFLSFGSSTSTTTACGSACSTTTITTTNCTSQTGALAVVVVCSTITSTSSTTTTISTSSTFNGSSDYQLWVKPYLPNLEKIREILMTPYNQAPQTYGYYAPIGLTCGGNIEASPAIGISGGNNNVCVSIDNNLEGSYSLDYFNSANSVLMGQPGFSPVSTAIYNTNRGFLSKTWYQVGGCSAPFPTFNYPGSFNGLYDRREGEYGFIGPYALQLINPGIHLGGIGQSCGTQGQTWYLPGYGGFTGTSMNNACATSPCIVTEFPSTNAINPTGNLETASFAIDELYMQCIAGSASCSLWQNAYHSQMASYPFSAPRQALHFIQMTRATQAWSYSNSTFVSNGMSSKTMLQNTINQIFTSAVGNSGGLCQSFGSCTGNDRTPEPNFQAMVAFDPRMPSWFVK